MAFFFLSYFLLSEIGDRNRWNAGADFIYSYCFGVWHTEGFTRKNSRPGDITTEKAPPTHSKQDEDKSFCALTTPWLLLAGRCLLLTQLPHNGAARPMPLMQLRCVVFWQPGSSGFSYQREGHDKCHDGLSGLHLPCNPLESNARNHKQIESGPARSSPASLSSACVVLQERNHGMATAQNVGVAEVDVAHLRLAGAMQACERKS